MKKITILIVLAFCVSSTTNAQFLKKLGETIQKSTERTIEKKVEQKTEETVEDAFDETFNENKTSTKTSTNSSNNNSTSSNNNSSATASSGVPGMSKATPANSYNFDHKITMLIESGKEIMNMDYYIPNSGNYFGIAFKDEKIDGEFYNVLDNDQETMFTFMESDGQKIRMGIDLKTDEADSEVPDISIVPTGRSKTILGYHCLEYLMTGEDMTANVWVTKDVDFELPKSFYNMEQNKKNNQKWMNEVDGWAMEMEMTLTSEKKPHVIKMKCLAIDKTNFILNSNIYKALSY